MAGEQVVILQPNRCFCFGDTEALFSLKATHLLYAYMCDLVQHYSYLQIKIKINETFSFPVPSFAELGVEYFLYRYMEVREMFDHVTCVYVW